jgi:hypothetical protein
MVNAGATVVEAELGDCNRAKHPWRLRRSTRPSSSFMVVAPDGERGARQWWRRGRHSPARLPAKVRRDCFAGAARRCVAGRSAGKESWVHGGRGEELPRRGGGLSGAIAAVSEGPRGEVISSRPRERTSAAAGRAEKERRKSAFLRSLAAVLFLAAASRAPTRAKAANRSRCTPRAQGWVEPPSQTHPEFSYGPSRSGRSLELSLRLHFR